MPPRRSARRSLSSATTTTNNTSNAINAINTTSSTTASASTIRGRGRGTGRPRGRPRKNPPPPHDTINGVDTINAVDAVDTTNAVDAVDTTNAVDAVDTIGSIPAKRQRSPTHDAIAIDTFSNDRSSSSSSSSSDIGISTDDDDDDKDIHHTVISNGTVMNNVPRVQCWTEETKQRVLRSVVAFHLHLQRSLLLRQRNTISSAYSAASSLLNSLRSHILHHHHQQQQQQQHISLNNTAPITAPQPTVKSVFARRPDGSFVRLVCPRCARFDFLNITGFVNHCRQSHALTFPSIEACHLQCGLPVDSAIVPENDPARFADVVSAFNALDSHDANQGSTPATSAAEIKVYHANGNNDINSDDDDDDDVSTLFSDSDTTSLRPCIRLFHSHASHHPLATAKPSRRHSQVSFVVAHPSSSTTIPKDFKPAPSIHNPSSAPSRFYIKKRILVGNVSQFIQPTRRHRETNLLLLEDDGSAGAGEFDVDRVQRRRRKIEEAGLRGSWTHKWMVYLRGTVAPEPGKPDPITSFVRKVRFFLHPSFAPYDVVDINEPPFQLIRYGWGDFPIRVQVHFVDDVNKPVDIIYMLRLDMALTGRQVQGGERIFDVELDKASRFRDVEKVILSAESKERQNLALEMPPLDDKVVVEEKNDAEDETEKEGMDMDVDDIGRPGEGGEKKSSDKDKEVEDVNEEVPRVVDEEQKMPEQSVDRMELDENVEMVFEDAKSEVDTTTTAEVVMQQGVVESAELETVEKQEHEENNVDENVDEKKENVPTSAIEKKPTPVLYFCHYCGMRLPDSVAIPTPVVEEGKEGKGSQPIHRCPYRPLTKNGKSKARVSTMSDVADVEAMASKILSASKLSTTISPPPRPLNDMEIDVVGATSTSFTMMPKALIPLDQKWGPIIESVPNDFIHHENSLRFATNLIVQWVLDQAIRFPFPNRPPPAPKSMDLTARAIMDGLVRVMIKRLTKKSSEIMAMEESENVLDFDEHVPDTEHPCKAKPSQESDVNPQLTSMEIGTVSTSGHHDQVPVTAPRRVLTSYHLYRALVHNRHTELDFLTNYYMERVKPAAPTTTGLVPATRAKDAKDEKKAEVVSDDD